MSYQAFEEFPEGQALINGGRTAHGQQTFDYLGELLTPYVRQDVFSTVSMQTFEPKLSKQ